MAKPRILVMDDEPVMLDIVVRFLEDRYDITAVSCMDDALTVLVGGDIDLVLTDIVIPGNGGGIELMAIVQQRWPLIPVILMTAHESCSLSDVPCFRLLIKPFRRADMCDVVEEGLEERQRRRAQGVGASVPAASVSAAVPAPVDTIYPYLVGGFLHDAKNALTSVAGPVELLMLFDEKPALFGDEPEAAKRDLMGAIMGGTQRLNRILSTLQAITRQYYASLALDATTPTAQLRDYLKELLDANAEKRIEITIDGLDAAPLPLGVVQVICSELLTNALRAWVEDVGTAIRLAVCWQPDTDALIIACEDTGRGFTEAHLTALQRGEVAAPPSAGTTGGFGLYLMHEIVRRLEGSMHFETVTPHGARVELTLPARRTAHESV